MDIFWLSLPIPYPTVTALLIYMILCQLTWVGLCFYFSIVKLTPMMGSGNRWTGLQICYRLFMIQLLMPYIVYCLWKEGDFR